MRRHINCKIYDQPVRERGVGIAIKVKAETNVTKCCLLRMAKTIILFQGQIFTSKLIMYRKFCDYRCIAMAKDKVNAPIIIITATLTVVSWLELLVTMKAGHELLVIMEAVHELMVTMEAGHELLVTLEAEHEVVVSVVV